MVPERVSSFSYLSIMGGWGFREDFPIFSRLENAEAKTSGALVV
jgi:hypothetical protein